MDPGEIGFSHPFLLQALHPARVGFAAAEGSDVKTADLERFYGLRRAVEVLARAAATDATTFLVRRPPGQRVYRVSQVPAGRPTLVRAREMSL